MTHGSRPRKTLRHAATVRSSRISTIPSARPVATGGGDPCRDKDGPDMTHAISRRHARDGDRGPRRPRQAGVPPRLARAPARSRRGCSSASAPAAATARTSTRAPPGTPKPSGPASRPDGGAGGFDAITPEAASWNGAPVRFPRIQGADAVGRIVAVGAGVRRARIGERVMVDGWLRDPGDPLDIEKAGYYGSERDGGFAEYATAPDANAVTGRKRSLRCRARHLHGRFLHGRGHDPPRRSQARRLGAGDRRLRRAWEPPRCSSSNVGGAGAIALCGASKAKEVRALGADATVPRETGDLVGAIGAIAPSGRVEGVVDVVGGPLFGQMIASLRPGGRYASSGAIGGPRVGFRPAPPGPARPRHVWLDP